MFTVSDVERVAKLASLQLEEGEKEAFAQQFSTILEYFEVLNAIDIPNSIEDRDESSMTRYRDDVTRVSSVRPQDFSPYLEEKGFKVPRVIEQG